MDLYLIRHTTPAVLAGTCYGLTDLDVSPSFPSEAAALNAKIADIQSPIVFSSPLQRCLKLAAIITSPPKIQVDDRLKELNFGDWEMTPWSTIPLGAIDIWSESHVLQAPPNGESFQALQDRVMSCISEITADPTSGPAIVVAHAGVIRAILASVMGLPLYLAFKLQIEYASVSKIIVGSEITKIGFINR